MFNISCKYNKRIRYNIYCIYLVFGKKIEDNNKSEYV